MAREGGRAAGAMWARAERSRRWRSLLALGLIAGVTTGVAMASIAGARRTDAAWGRLRAETHASDAIVSASQKHIDEPDWDRIASLPYVEAAGAFGLAYTADGGGIFVTAYGDWLRDLDRPRLIEGRQPRAANEIVITRPDGLSKALGEEIGVGSKIPLHFLTRAQFRAADFAEAKGPEVELEVVGVGRSPFDLAAIPSTGDAYAGPDFLEEYGDGIAVFSNLLVRLEDPERDLPRLEAEVAKEFPNLGVPVYDLQAAGKRVTNGTDFERLGLLLFASAVVAAGLVVVGQALSRSIRATTEDVEVLRSLGLSRSESALAIVRSHILPILVGIPAALAVALVLSPRFPIGLGRQVDPDVGIHADLAVLLTGAVVVAALLLLGVMVTAWRMVSATNRADRRERRSTIAAMLRNAGASITKTVGASLAFEPGRGRRAVPTRAALAGAIVGALGVTGAFTLAAGIADGSAHPERFGTVWDMEVTFNSAEPDAAYKAVVESLPDRPDVDAVAHVARWPLPVTDDVVIPFYALQPVAGTLQFELLEGRAPETSDEIVLGPDTARVLGAGVGDHVELGDDNAFRVVGTGLLPTTPHSSYDQGAWVAPTGLRRAFPAAELPGFQQAVGLPETPTQAEATDMLLEFGDVVARFKDGVDVEAVGGKIADDAGDSVRIEAPAEAADQLSLRNVRRLPLLFGVFAACLAAAALAHVSTSVVRQRRGDLAALQALGLTKRQVRSCIRWQAVLLTLVGLLIGIPVGAITGRLIWRSIAHTTPMIYVPPVAVTALVLIAPIALLVAAALAAFPAWRAARLRPAEVLRAE